LLQGCLLKWPIFVLLVAIGQTLLENILFVEQPGRSKNGHQHPKDDQDQSESEWRWIAWRRSRHRPTDIGHSYSKNYEQYADTKHYPVLIHGNPSNLRSAFSDLRHPSADGSTA